MSIKNKLPLRLMNKERKLAYSIASVVFVAIAWFFYREVWDMKPFGMHDWAQSDRLSLAYGFLRNGFNLFKPETFFLHKSNTIVSVELPLQAYIAALGASVLGKEHLPAIFRILNISSCLLAMGLVYHWVYQKTQKMYWALIAPVFFISMPLMAFYGGNFLPDPIACVLIVVGYYAFFKYIDTQKMRFIYGNLLVLLLASLIKMTSAFYLPVFCCLQLIYIYKHKGIKADLFKFLTACAIVLGILLAAYIHMKQLGDIYKHTVFLSDFKVYKGRLLQFIPSIHEVLLNKSIYYLTFIQDISLWVSITVVFYAGIRYKKYRLYLITWLLTGIPLIGVFLLMHQQFLAHDYYGLICFYPFFILPIIFTSLIVGDWLKNEQRFTPFGSVLLVIVFLFFGYKALNDNYYTAEGILDQDWVVEAEIDLELIEEDARVLMFSGFSPNIGLVYFERIGKAKWNMFLDQKTVEIANYMEKEKLNYLIGRKHLIEEKLLAKKDWESYWELHERGNNYYILKRRYQNNNPRNL